MQQTIYSVQMCRELTRLQTLTFIYHVTQRKINIRKETSMSISIFSMASFISMVALLALVCSSRTDYLTIPLVAAARWAWLEGVKVAFSVLDYGNFTGDFL